MTTTVSQISAIERGTSRPSIESFVAICRGFEEARQKWWGRVIIRWPLPGGRGSVQLDGPLGFQTSGQLADRPRNMLN